MQRAKTFKELTAQQKQKVLIYAKLENEGVRYDKDHRDYWKFQETIRQLIFFDKWDGILTDEVKKVIGEQ